MPFQPGQSGNPQGRPQGAKGSMQAEIRNAISATLADRSDRIAEMLDKVSDPVKWLEIYVKLAGMVIPKESKVEIHNPYEDWTDEELAAEVEKLNSQLTPNH